MTAPGTSAARSAQAPEAGVGSRLRFGIRGIGVVSARGRGLAAFEQALREGWQPPEMENAPSAPAGMLPVYRVRGESLVAENLSRVMRRADRFSKMAVVAAADALKDAGLAGVAGARVGLVVATAFGPHVTTFRFLDDILEYGDGGVSPTVFSHSVHNAAASYVAMALDIRGPLLTLTHFHFAFHESLIAAGVWLAEGRCDYVLVGVAEEFGAVMGYICSRKISMAEDGRIAPFAFSAAPRAVPGEGSVFFLVGRADARGASAEMAGVAFGSLAPAAAPPSVHLLDADGLALDESPYAKVAAAAGDGRLFGSYAPVFGSLMTGSAFHGAVGALMLKRQTLFACPAPYNPWGLPLCRDTAPAEVRRVWITKCGCRGETATIQMEAPS